MAMTDEADLAVLDGMTRPQRLMLKRAYASSTARPLMIEGPNMQKVADQMHQLEYLTPVRSGFILSKTGWRLALLLRVAGWPNCEKPRAKKSKGNT